MADEWIFYITFELPWVYYQIVLLLLLLFVPHPKAEGRRKKLWYFSTSSHPEDIRHECRSVCPSGSNVLCSSRPVSMRIMRIYRLAQKFSGLHMVQNECFQQRPSVKPKEWGDKSPNSTVHLMLPRELSGEEMKQRICLCCPLFIQILCCSRDSVLGWMCSSTLTCFCSTT